MKKIIILSLFIIVLASIVFYLFKNQKANQVQKRTRFLLDTYCTIQIPGNEEMVKIIDKALDRIEEINIKFNILNPESPLYDFNEKNIPVTDPEILALVETALKVSEQSNGAFDITVEPLVKLWGFYDKNPAIPDKEKIIECLKNIGYKNLVIKENKLIKLKNNIKIDLGAIAKGYAVGEAVKVIKTSGVKSALIDAGGDIYAFGKIKGKFWKVGIRNPRGDGILGALEIEDLSLATSGDYERFFEKDGIRYHHILDPKTGYPSKGLISVTVISPDTTLADAWSTALFVMGKEKGMEIVEKTSVAQVIMVDSDRKISYSSGLKKNLEIVGEGGKI